MRILGIDPGLARVGYGVIDTKDGRSNGDVVGHREAVEDFPHGAGVLILEAGRCTNSSTEGVA